MSETGLRITKREHEVLTCLDSGHKDNQQIYPAGYEAGHGPSEQTISFTISALVRRGFVEEWGKRRGGRKIWAITREGEEALAAAGGALQPPAQLQRVKTARERALDALAKRLRAGDAIHFDADGRYLRYEYLGERRLRCIGMIGAVDDYILDMARDPNLDMDSLDHSYTNHRGRVIVARRVLNREETTLDELGQWASGIVECSEFTDSSGGRMRKARREQLARELSGQEATKLD